jgi:putative hydrolase of HD superfamily
MGGLAATTLGLTLTATIASRLFSLHPLHCASLPHRRQVLVRPRGKWRMGEGRGAGDAGGSSQTEDDWTQPAAAVESSSMPESVLASSSGKAAASAASAVQFLSLCQRLKTTKRTGWVNHGVKESESIADHMYRMAVMAIIATDIPGINRDRCVKMAVVHDIAEAIVGDITPSDGVSKEEKNRRESAAMDEMCQLLGGGIQAEEMKELWMEYENNSSAEAKLVKDFDKVEMILQALEYETEQGKNLEDFFNSTKGKFQTNLGKAWAAEITGRRKQRLEEPLE